MSDRTKAWIPWLISAATLAILMLQTARLVVRDVREDTKEHSDIAHAVEQLGVKLGRQESDDEHRDRIMAIFSARQMWLIQATRIMARHDGVALPPIPQSDEKPSQGQIRGMIDAYIGTRPDEAMR